MSSSSIFVGSFVIAGLFGVMVAVIAIRASGMKVTELRARGIYPEVGKEKEEDVLRLLQSGQKIMAIRCYRSLHKVGLKEAKDAVELLEQKPA